MSGFVRIPEWVGEFVIGAARLLDVEYLEIPGVCMHRWAPEPGTEPIIEVVESGPRVRYYALDNDPDSGVGSS